jgi:ADP-heptose:LPS heptosyltransferase
VLGKAARTASFHSTEKNLCAAKPQESSARESEDAENQTYSYKLKGKKHNVREKQLLSAFEWKTDAGQVLSNAWNVEAFARKRIPNVRKLAVLRANRLGDFLFILPALEALRATYPQAELVLFALPWHAAFLSQRPSPVDRVIEVPPYGGVSAEPQERADQTQVSRFFQAMRQESFDLACQFHGGGHFSNPFIKQLGASVTIGLKAEDAVPLDRWLPYRSFQSEYIRYLEAASLAGAQSDNLEPHLTVTEQDRAEAESVLPETTQPLAVLHPGAIDPGRCWPSEKFALVGDALARSGLRVALSGTRD